MLDAEKFAAWMARDQGISNARIVKTLGGGNSNLTQLVDSDQGAFIVRSTPPSASHADASGLRREFRVLKAIEGELPTPRAIAFCEDRGIADAPFVLTTFAPGVVISSELPQSYPRTEDVFTVIGQGMVDALARLHRVDWRRAGLEDMARPSDYIERQIGRWLDVREKNTVRELPRIHDLGRWLLDNRPPDAPTALIHGDYHLENVLFATDEPKVSAVIDWELATIGDPLTDLGLFLLFWGPRDADRPAFEWVQRSSRRPGIIGRAALAERWSHATGIGVDWIDYYQCFAGWRLAVVVESAYVQFRRGLLDTAFARGLERDVPVLLEEAAQIVGQ